MADEIRKHAVISDDQQYRYMLGRSWGRDWFHGGSLVTWVMLNPSTADAELDDQTIRQCVHYSQREGFDQLAVVNLYAFRSPYPKDLLLASDPIGPENLTYVKHYMTMADKVVVAWGNHGLMAQHEETYDAILHKGVADPDRFWCLGFNKGGQPKHPARVGHGLALVPWAALQS